MKTISKSVLHPTESGLLRCRGFTRGDLLLTLAVVIALGFVVYASLPTGGCIVSKPHATVRNAYQIQLGMVAYAQAHDGKFPDGKTANEVLRQLFVADLVDDENVFFVQGSAWSHRKSDGNKGTAADGFARALEPGENHWACVRGLNLESDPTLPIVADGFAEGKPGKWSADPKGRGGLWKGNYAIVVRVGGNAKLCNLDASLTVKEKKEQGDSELDIFSADYGTNPANILNPE